MGTVMVKERQTLLDIALQTSGSVEAVMELAKQNGLSITDGQVLEVKEVKDVAVVSHYEINCIFPATEASDEERSAMAYEGIGFMAIENDFVVS